MNDLNHALFSDQYSLAGAIYATQFFSGLGPINASLAKSGMSRLDLIRMYEKAIAEKHARVEGNVPQAAPLPRKRKLMRRPKPEMAMQSAPVLNKPLRPQANPGMQLQQAREIMRQMIAQYRLQTLSFA